MAVDVSRIPNNNKFDPVREAILDLQTSIEDTGAAIGNGTLTINTSGILTGTGTFTANQTGPTTISIGIDGAEYLTNITHDTVNQKLVVTKGDATTFDIDLSQYIDDTNLARLVSGTLDNQTGIATFTRDDATTFDVDLSALFDDTDTNDFLTSAAFSTANGIITFGVTNQDSVTVDIDGRYPLISELSAVADDIITSADFSATDNRFKLTLTQADAGTIEASFDDVVLSAAMDADFIPYVSTAGGDGDTTNAILSQSWLKFNSDTLEVGNVSDPVSVDSKIIKISRQIGIGDKQITEFKAQGIFVTSTTATYGTKNSRLQFNTNGRLNVNNAYTLPEGDGTSGQVLSTDGSGDLSWVAAGGPTTSDLQDVTDNGAVTDNPITVPSILVSATAPLLDFVDTNSFTDANDRFRIRAAGDVGQIRWYDDSAGTDTVLATFNPNGNFDVLGSITSNGNTVFTVAGGTVSGTITAAGGINMNNANITGVNNIVINDAGAGEGIEWAGGNLWKIYESPNNLTNASGNLQFVTNATRRMTIDTSGNLDVTGGITANGNVGIGKSPDERNVLDIQSNNTSGVFVTHRNDTGFFLNRTYADYNNDGVTVEYQERVGVDGNKVSIGTFSGHALSLRTSNTDRVYIQSTGDVGIGTTSPLSRLHIAAPDPSTDFNLIDFRNTGGYGIYAKTNSIASRGQTLEFMAVDYNLGGTVITRESLCLRPEGEVGIGTTTPDSKLDVTATGAHGIVLNRDLADAANSSRLFFLSSGGNIGLFANAGRLDFRTGSTPGSTSGNRKMTLTQAGDLLIGTGTSPAEKLHVSGNIRAENTTSTSFSYLEAMQSSTQFLRIHHLNSGWTTSGTNIANSGLITAGSGSTGGMVLRTDANAPIIFATNGTSNERVRITGSGNVGIGTTSPTNKLDVNGTIRARGGVTSDNSAKEYYWHSNNTGNSGTIWRKIGTYNASGQSSRIMITAVGTASYSGGQSSGKTTIIAQVNNNNLLEGSFWQEGMVAQYGAVRFNSTSATNHEIYYQVSSYSEFAFEALISDGTFTPDATTVSNPTYTRSATREWNVNNNLWVSSSNNVGIGTTSPTGKLNIQQSSLNTAALFIGRYNAEDSPIIQIGESTSFSGTGSYGEALIASRNRDIVFSTGDFQSLSSVNTAAMIIEKGEGNVGIGTTSPATKLHVVGDTTNNQLRIERTGTATGKWNIYTNYNQLYFQNAIDSAIPLMISSDDRVGIGTTSPASKLHVEGTGEQWVSVYSSNGGLNGIRTQSSSGSRQNTFYRDSATNIVYVRSGTDDGEISFIAGGSSSNAMYIDSSQRVGIGTTSPSEKLTVAGNISLTGNINFGSSNGDINLSRGSYITFYENSAAGHSLSSRNSAGSESDDIRLDTYGSFIINIDSNNNNSSDADFRIGRHGTTGTISSWLFEVNGETGAGTFSGDVIAFGSPSDRSLKENIKPIEGALDKVKKLQGVTFDWKQNDDDILKIKEDYGFIAQEVQEVLPELVRENENGKLSLRDKGIISVLVEAMKEQQKQIDELKARLDA